MGFSEIQLLKRLGEQFNIVIVSIGSILVYLVVYGTHGVSRKARWICVISSCVFSNLVFRLEFNDETCLNVESSRILEKALRHLRVQKRWKLK